MKKTITRSFRFSWSENWHEWTVIRPGGYVALAHVKTRRITPWKIKRSFTTAFFKQAL